MNTSRIENPEIIAKLMQPGAELIHTVVDKMPGLVPAFESIFDAYAVDETISLETMAYLFQVVRSRSEAQNAQAEASH